METLLPAVVVGIETPIGLAVIRDLGSAGVPVYGMARSSESLGLASRYITRGEIRVPDEEGLIRQLIALSAEIGPACLFAVSENDIAMLNRHRDRLGSYCLTFPDEARMARVLHKGRTYHAAEKVGIRVPKTVQINSVSELDALGGTLRYPVVLKWANPHEVARLLSGAGLTLHKLQYCDSPPELLNEMKTFERVGVYPLIQEYCAGYGLGQFFLMKDGIAHYSFQHRRVHEWPPEGGFSSMAESISVDQHRNLMERSVALLKELEWEGVAMVEYRHDPATGESALMEINGRFWGSLPLAHHAGARFPWACYQLLGRGMAITQDNYVHGMRCRFMVPETKRLIRILFARHKIADKRLKFSRIGETLNFFSEFLSPRSKYYVYDASDSAPFFSDVHKMLGKVGAIIKRR